MPSRIEDYALIGDLRTAAMVARDGSIDWLCVPRFDSAACFANLLGSPENGRWKIAPSDEIVAIRRRYRGDTLILETEFETNDGLVRVLDFMPSRESVSRLIRIVEGVRGRIKLRSEFILRFDYGSRIPWVRKLDDGIALIGGPDAVELRAGVELRGEGLKTVADFEVGEGDRVPFVLSWHPSHQEPPVSIDVEAALRETEEYWVEWSSRCGFEGPDRSAVVRSAITLKALTYAPTGGIVAAATTSLPEKIGGVRNWDYRYCWLRDATFTLFALTLSGYRDEAAAWREWLLRAVAGDPSQLQVMYGLAGERRLTEFELPHLSGFEDSKPVRVGNAASGQFQLDVYGEVLSVFHQCRRVGLEEGADSWMMERMLIDFVETHWKEPDQGIWEVRDGRRHFTHSKVMAWVGLDRAVKAVEEFGCDGPVERWKAIRDEIHREVCDRGFHREKNSFVQSYGSENLDASLLMLPLVGFLPATDPRMVGTVEAIERELMRGGLVLRYLPDPKVDGLPPGEGVFLMCTAWLADCYALMGQRDKARALLDRLLSLRNDVGLLAEEYDPDEARQLGNVPQAFSHVSLIITSGIVSGSFSPIENPEIRPH